MEQSPDKDPLVHLGANATFHSRNDAIFGSLTALEQKHEDTTPKDDPFSEVDVAEKQHRKPRRPARVPDHVLHPQKYKKYSLEEDGTKTYGHEDGGSSAARGGDDLNKRVALDFLNGLKERKNKEQKDTNKEDETVSPEKSSLKRKRDQVIADEEQAVIESVGNEGTEVTTGSSGTCHKMQAYEFGQKDQKRGDKSLPKIDLGGDIGNKLNLSHLEDENDEKSDPITDVDATSTSDKSNFKFSKSRKMKKNLRKSHNSAEDDQ